MLRPAITHPLFVGAGCVRLLTVCIVGNSETILTGRGVTIYQRVIEREQKDKTISKFCSDASLPYFDIDIKNLIEESQLGAALLMPKGLVRRGIQKSAI